jgi:hypothetical protein
MTLLRDPEHHVLFKNYAEVKVCPALSNCQVIDKQQAGKICSAKNAP